MGRTTRLTAQSGIYDLVDKNRTIVHDSTMHMIPLRQPLDIHAAVQSFASLYHRIAWAHGYKAQYEISGHKAVLHIEDITDIMMQYQTDENMLHIEFSPDSNQRIGDYIMKKITQAYTNLGL